MNNRMPPSSERTSAIHDLGVLQLSGESAIDRLTALAGEMLGVDECLITVVLDEEQRFVSRYDVGEPGMSRTPLSHSYCQHVVASGEPLIASDARQHPILRDNPAIEAYGALAYAGYPVQSPDGTILGTFCAIDHQPREWSDRDLRILRAFAAVVASELHLRRGPAPDDRSAATQFFANAVHELRTPLTSISGFAATLNWRWDELTEQQRREFVMIIDDQSVRLSSLVENLLTLSRIEMGSLPRAPRVFGLKQLLDDIAMGFPGVEIEVRCDAGVKLEADPEHVRQMIVNLTANAAKYGDPPIIFEASDHGDVVDIHVSDFGSGVPDSFRAVLFDRFTQSDQRRCAPGHGLGLAIVAELADLNGGSCQYVAHRGRGATFVIKLQSGSAGTVSDALQA